MKLKILVNDPLAPDAITILKGAGLDVDEREYSKVDLPKYIGEYDGIIVRSATKVTKEVIDAGKKLKVIGRAGVGLDNIDLNAAKARGIAVLSTPTANAISVAELVFGFMISVSRHIVTGTTTLRDGKWEKKALDGVELYGKTLGIIGFGNIGAEVAKRAFAFGMKVITYDVIQNKRGLDVEFVPLNDLLKNSDYITVHLPLLDSTKHMISDDQFSMMKKSAIFVHAARGGIVDDKALLNALKSGKIAGAALDVFEAEPLDDVDREIVSMPNVVATPHLGASTIEAQGRVGREIAEKVVEFFKGVK